VLLAAPLLSCQSTGDSAIDAEALIAFEGLRPVEHSGPGALFVRPDHGISEATLWTMGDVRVSYESGSPSFGARQTERVKQYLRDAAYDGMLGGGSQMVDRPGLCVVSMNLALVDVALSSVKSGLGNSAATVITNDGGTVTLVLDLRDSQTNERLLVYGSKRLIAGDVVLGSGLPSWVHLRKTFDQLLFDQRQTLLRSVPESVESPRSRRCS
jgi:hypothetical protein